MILSDGEVHFPNGETTKQEELFSEDKKEDEDSSKHDKLYKCPILGCDKINDTMLKLSRHLNTHESSEYICSLCNNKYEDKRLFMKHLNEHNIMLGIKCKLCGDSFVSRKKLYIHERRHEEARGKSSNEYLEAINKDVEEIILNVIDRYK